MHGLSSKQANTNDSLHIYMSALSCVSTGLVHAKLGVPRDGDLYLRHASAARLYLQASISIPPS